MAVHAALQATVDAFFQRADLAFAPTILRELAPHAHQGHSVRLGAGLEVAVLTSKATARVALSRIGRRRTDLVWGIGNEGIAVLDEFAEGIISDRANAWRRPFREIDLWRVGGRCFAPH